MNKISILPKDKALILVCGALTALMIGLAVVGACRAYSPIPFKDMWNGYLNFFVNVTDGDSSAWWVLHNEHRIILSRILFWMDFKWFDGTVWFLVAVNYFLVSASALLFWRILRHMAATEKPTTGEILLGLFVTAWLFLWVQRSNLTWGFQSQFFLAQLLPLSAFYWLHKSTTEINPNRHFSIACLFGLASLGTMANGILALPLMTLYALIIGKKAKHVWILASLSVGVVYLFFPQAQPSFLHDKSLEIIKETPFALVHYVLLYLGSPFYYLSGKGAVGKAIGVVASLLLIGSSIWFAVKSLRKPRENTLNLSLLLFILYIGGSAFGTASGRLVLGVDQAMAGRYSTPVVMVWAALLVLYSPTIFAAIKEKGIKVLAPFAVLSIPMIILQSFALKSQDGQLFEQKIAALALELQVNDQKQISNVYIHKVQLSLSAAQKASALNLSIFGVYPYRDAREQLGLTIPKTTLPVCQGNFDKMETIEGDVRFVRVRGWLFDNTSKTYPQVVRFLDRQGKVVGYALTGETRKDIAEATDKKALKAGFRGYLFAEQKGATLTLQGENPSCEKRASVPL